MSSSLTQTHGREVALRAHNVWRRITDGSPRSKTHRRIPATIGRAAKASSSPSIHPERCFPSNDLALAHRPVRVAFPYRRDGEEPLPGEWPLPPVFLAP